MGSGVCELEFYHKDMDKTSFWRVSIFSVHIFTLFERDDVDEKALMHAECREVIWYDCFFLVESFAGGEA